MPRTHDLSHGPQSGFEPQLDLKQDGKDGSLDGSKYNKYNKDSQLGQVTPKKINFFPF